MKAHLIIELTTAIDRNLPNWEDILDDKGNAPTSSMQSLDFLLNKKYDVPYWLTYNFRPKNKEWSHDEIQSGFNKIYRLILQKNQNIPKNLIEEIRLLPEVKEVKIGSIATTEFPEKSETKSLSSRYRNNGVFLKEAHFYSKGSPQIKIAVLDTGFEVDHSEIKNAMLPGKDFVNIINGANQFIGDFMGLDNLPEDEVGHGTHVAGIIAGRGLKMPIGVVPNCKILPVKVLGALKRGNKIVGAGLIDNINNGIKWAVDQEVDVINMSLGIKHAGGGLPHEKVIKYALRKGVSIVAASGNDGKNDKYYPGALPGVIAVGASDPSGRVAPFSTYGGHVSLIAPGTNIYSSFLNNGYWASSGTSQAAPFVAGGIALLKSFARDGGRRLSDKQAKYILKHSSDKVSNQYKDKRAGFGQINLLDALKLLKYKFKINSYV